jgi:uncharacterized protein GlcG (DUF336 family)
MGCGQRVDGVNKGGVETGRMKAESALYLFRVTSGISNFAKTPSGAANPGGEAILVLLKGYMSAGGLPTMVDGEVAGSIGVGGMAPNPPNQTQVLFSDEQCAQAGIDAVLKK